MIQSVWATNQIGEKLELYLRSSKEDVGLLVFNLEGLGSPKSTINDSGGPAYPGTRVSSVTVDARQLILTLAVNPGIVDEEEVRDIVYRYFPINQKITFGVKTDRADYCIDAYVEQNEFNEFATVENCVISMYCPFPYFMNVVPVVASMDSDSGISLFSFPFSNPATETEILFGEYSGTGGIRVTYNSLVETGVDLSLYFTGSPGDIVFINDNGDQEMNLYLEYSEYIYGGPIAAGDQILINTRLGQKSATLIRSGGATFNILGAVGVFDDWLTIKPGTNNIIFTADNASVVNVGLQFNALREGI